MSAIDRRSLTQLLHEYPKLQKRMQQSRLFPELHKTGKYTLRLRKEKTALRAQHQSTVQVDAILQGIADERNQIFATAPGQQFREWMKEEKKMRAELESYLNEAEHAVELDRRQIAKADQAVKAANRELLNVFTNDIGDHHDKMLVEAEKARATTALTAAAERLQASEDTRHVIERMVLLLGSLYHPPSKHKAGPPIIAVKTLTGTHLRLAPGAGSALADIEEEDAEGKAERALGKGLLGRATMGRRQRLQYFGEGY